ncbi:MAG: PAS domain-containing protein, partial [bacterium]
MKAENQKNQARPQAEIEGLPAPPADRVGGAAGLSGERLRLLTDSLPLLISYVDAELIYRHANKAYEAWFGHRSESLVGRHVADFLGAEAYRALEGNIQRVLAGETVKSEATVPYQWGGPRHTQSIYVPEFDEKGAVKGFFVSVTDISDVKKIEEKLQQTLELLEAKVGERTAELEKTNAELRKQIAQRKKAQTALLENERLLQTTFDTLPLPVWVKDKKLRFIRANPAMAAVYG